MALLFSYGTLQQVEVQIATFGRPLKGRRDELVGYAPALVKIEDPQLAATLGRTHHNNVTCTAREADRVSGTVLQVTDPELVRADAYEAPFSYSRVGATLATGAEAWVYVHTPPRSSTRP